MTVERSFDHEALDAILNHPEVFQWVAKPEHNTLCSKEIVENGSNYLLLNEDKSGALLFVFQEPCVYEVHTQFLPGARGSAAFKFTCEALDWMFLRTDVMEILTVVPEGNKAADSLARIVGGQLDFSREAAWTMHNGDVVNSNYYGLRYADWIRRAGHLESVGAAFHDKLEGMVPQAAHDDDSAHDRHVGAAFEMIRYGQAAKAVLLYNRWARFAGYATISIVSANPLIIDIQSALLVIGKDGQFTAVAKPEI